MAALVLALERELARLPRSVPLVLALCPVVITIVAVVDRLELALACLLEQSRDVTAVQRTGELQRLIDPHADAFAEQFFRSHRWTELSCALGFGAELDQPALHLRPPFPAWCVSAS